MKSLFHTSSTSTGSFPHVKVRTLTIALNVNKKAAGLKLVNPAVVDGAVLSVADLDLAFAVLFHLLEPWLYGLAERQ